jgi:hypothetical protein
MSSAVAPLRTVSTYTCAGTPAAHPKLACPCSSPLCSDCDRCLPTASRYSTSSTVVPLRLQERVGPQHVTPSRQTLTVLVLGQLLTKVQQIQLYTALFLTLCPCRHHNADVHNHHDHHCCQLTRSCLPHCQFSRLYVDKRGKQHAHKYTT